MHFDAAVVKVRRTVYPMQTGKILAFFLLFLLYLKQMGPRVGRGPAFTFDLSVTSTSV